MDAVWPATEALRPGFTTRGVANRKRDAMDEKQFQCKLAELMGEISTLPKSERDKLSVLANETQQRHKKLRQSVGQLQESLDHLRLSIKYLVFDLEATRRENRYLRRMLEHEQPGGPDSEEDNFSGGIG